ncbi:MAG: PaaI family thioesterase [Frankia sp.]
MNPDTAASRGKSDTGASTSERWTFGVEPLPQSLVVAPLLRRVAGLVPMLEDSDPSVERLIEDLRAAERALAGRVPADLAPRLGADASTDRRSYVDHSRDVGAFNPCFPEYEIAVDGQRASGTVSFPVVFEGPPAIVHGGALATFFDCVIQHHNCDVGVAGKTTSLLVDYRRPTPLGVPLGFEIDREAEARRITSRARLFLGNDTLCTATMAAVAGNRDRLPHVPPRRTTP